uniref:Uncharacterized protein n=1 Tax=Bartonella schoenbuchensis (strain DSM 13525 / NCTC 13165 / R1) TaxID=687861 RepID=E6Z0A2_BARSR|nr:hypothetical protein B11C_40395 [Bartonella schoenbuchensis R1]
MKTLNAICALAKTVAWGKRVISTVVSELWTFLFLLTTNVY